MPVPAAHYVNGHPLQAPFPAGMQQALFGMGCFWGAERKFWELKGVYSTAVGYAAGQTPNPTYREVCSGMTGHAEVVLVVFDPAVISYDELLRVFWESHDPTQGMRQGNDVGTQYRSGVYYFDESQRIAAERSRDAFQHELSDAGYRPDHDRDRRGAGVLLRGRLSPAISRQESGWLLRTWRNRRELSRRRRQQLRRRVDAPIPQVIPLPIDSRIWRRSGHRSTAAGQRSSSRSQAPARPRACPRPWWTRGRSCSCNRRRVAARAIAQRIADEQGWQVGREIGWQIRFERRFSRDTRLLVVTEGILTARLQSRSAPL